MKYAIFVLLLLAFGCAQQAPTDPGADNATGAIADSGIGNGTADASDGAVTDGSANGSTDNGSVDASQPLPTNLDWGTECEYDSQCGSFGSMMECVMGHCVKSDCIFRSDCKEKDHCFRGKCYLESELYAEFTECGVSQGCNETCAGCLTGQRRCMISGWSNGEEEKDYYICVECNSDYDCSEGYRCVQNYCLPGPN